MNKKRRAALKKASDYLEMAIDIVQDAKYEEEDCFNNYPENLENTDQYEAMGNAIDYLDDTLDTIREAKESLESAINC